MNATWQGAREIVPLAKNTFTEFQRHRAQWLAAAIAYFAVFAVAPLVLVAAEIAAVALGHHGRALHQLYGYLSHASGPSAARAIRALVAATQSQHRSGTIAQIVGWIVFIFAAAGLFSSLQVALNTIWDAEPEKKGLVQTVQAYVTSFGMVLAIGLMLLIFVGLNAALTAADDAFARIVGFLPTLVKIGDFILSVVGVTALFVALFTVLPARRIAWRDTLLGAAISAVLFVVGQFFLGWYLGRTGLSSAYGSFGAIVVFLVWTFYSTQILLFGAELTKVCATRYGASRASATRGEIPAPPSAVRKL